MAQAFETGGTPRLWVDSLTRQWRTPDRQRRWPNLKLRKWHSSPSRHCSQVQATFRRKSVRLRVVRRLLFTYVALWQITSGTVIAP